MQRPRKHFESGGALAKRGTFVYDQNKGIERFYIVHEPNEHFLKIWNLYNVGNGFYRVFTTAKRVLSFQQKRAFIHEILCSASPDPVINLNHLHLFTHALYSEPLKLSQSLLVFLDLSANYPVFFYFTIKYFLDLTTACLMCQPLGQTNETFSYKIMSQRRDIQSYN